MVLGLYFNYYFMYYSLESESYYKKVILDIELIILPSMSKKLIMLMFHYNSLTNSLTCFAHW